jgi:SLOG in TRPM, prokaryote/SMODS and SLOG-associating 2TM effector domain 1/Protein of unknown function (DUF4231)
VTPLHPVLAHAGWGVGGGYPVRRSVRRAVRGSVSTVCYAEAHAVTEAESGRVEERKAKPGPTPCTITFSYGHTAQILDVPRSMRAPEILAALGLNSSRPVVAIVGGASKLEERVKPRLAQLFSRAVARVAADRGALIIDGGTAAGVMAIIGQGVADRGHRSTLLGVAPAAKVTYPGGPSADSVPDGAPLEPNHTHFVLVQDSDWGGEVGTMDALAQALAGDQPAVTILADGGPIAVDEVVRSVRRRWPILVLAGSGRFADQLVKLSKNERAKAVEDPRFAEILAEGKLHVFPATGTVEDLARVLNRYFDPPEPDPALDAAWRLFAWLDVNATAERTTFERLQKWIIRLGVLATALALVQSQLSLGLPPDVMRLLPDWLATSPVSWLIPQGLQFTLVLVTVVTTILLGAVARFKAGSRWVLLRGGAEAVKREIFRYRARANPYGDPTPIDDARRSQQLANRVNVIANNIFTTEISELALRPYRGTIPPQMYGAGADDSGFGQLSPSRYVAIRVGDQITYYRGRAMQLDRRLKRAHWAMLVLGGVATLLAAVGAQLWVPMAAALIAAVGAYLEYQQVGATLAKYNQAIANLLGIEAWWGALPESEKGSADTLNKLVGSTEDVLQAELSGWVRQMHDALDRLRSSQQRGSSQDGEGGRNSA